MNTSLFTSHGFELSDEELSAFEKFLTLFIEYNSHTNLSAIRDEEGIVEKHFVDSLYGASVIGGSLPLLGGAGGGTPPSLPYKGRKSTPKLLDIGSG